MKDTYFAVLLIVAISASIFVVAEYTYLGIERREVASLTAEEREVYAGPLSPTRPVDVGQYRLVHLGITLGMIVCILIGMKEKLIQPPRRNVAFQEFVGHFDV